MKRVALVVSIDRYGNPGIAPLRYSGRDARRTSRWLRRVLGFDLVEELRGRKVTNRTLLATLRCLVGSLEAGDMFVFYFSGHAVQDLREQLPYLACHEADVDAIQERTGDFVAVASILKILNMVSGVTALLLIDGCRSSLLPGGKAFAGASSDFAVGIKNLIGGPGTNPGAGANVSVVCSCSAGAHAFESRAEKGSVFTVAFWKVVARCLQDRRKVEVDGRFVDERLKPEMDRISLSAGLGSQQPTLVQPSSATAVTLESCEAKPVSTGWKRAVFAVGVPLLVMALTISNRSRLERFRGEVEFFTTPGAAIELVHAGGATREAGRAGTDGRLKVESLEVGVGWSYRIGLSNYYTETGSVPRVQFGKLATIHQPLRPMPGRLSIQGPEDMEIWAGTERVGLTQGSIFLAPDSYYFEVRRPGFRSQHLAVEITPNAEVSRQVQNWERLAGSLRVQVDAPDIKGQPHALRSQKLYIDGIEVHASSFPHEATGLAPGKRTVRVEVEGFVPAELADVEILDGQVALIRFALRPLPAAPPPAIIAPTADTEAPTIQTNRATTAIASPANKTNLVASAERSTREEGKTKEVPTVADKPHQTNTQASLLSTPVQGTPASTDKAATPETTNRPVPAITPARIVVSQDGLAPQQGAARRQTAEIDFSDEIALGNQGRLKMIRDTPGGTVQDDLSVTNGQPVHISDRTDSGEVQIQWIEEGRLIQGWIRADQVKRRTKTNNETNKPR